jgi:hypothetical protein
LESGSSPCHFQESIQKKATAFKMMNFAEITCAKVAEICVEVA